jgi:hypothetical protein
MMAVICAFSFVYAPMDEILMPNASLQLLPEAGAERSKT